MNDFSGPFFDASNPPFDPATGKLTRLFKGGSRPIQSPQPAAAAETPTLVDQASRDQYLQDQKRQARNQTVIGSGQETAWGAKLKLGQ